MQAAKMTGLTAIPAIRVEGDAAEISLIENPQRDDLKPIEEAEALSRLKEERGYTVEKLATISIKANQLFRKY